MSRNPEGLDEEQRDDRYSKAGSARRRAYEMNRAMDARRFKDENPPDQNTESQEDAKNKPDHERVQAEEVILAPETKQTFKDKVGKVFAREEELLTGMIEGITFQDRRIELAEQLADLNLFKRDLEKLGTPVGEKRAREHPQYVAEALAQLASWMSEANQFNPDNVTRDQSYNERLASQFINARQLFIECSTKLYPELRAPAPEQTDKTVNLARGTFLHAKNRDLSDLHNTVDILRGAQKKREQHPKILLADLHDVIGEMGVQLRKVKSSDKLAKQDLIELAAAEKAMYSLLLLQDSVSKELNGPDLPKISEQIEESAEGVQSWLDREREEAYKGVRDYFLEIMGEGTVEEKERNIRKWWLEFCNKSFASNKVELLKPEHVESLLVIDYKSEAASKIAGKEISRPMIVYTDLKEYKEFASRFNGVEDTSAGMNIWGGNFHSESPFHKTGLIVTVAAEENMNHEILHSIDPHVDTRKGPDGILCEAFTFYQDRIVEADGSIEEGFWRLTKMMSHYYHDYGQDADPPMSPEEFKEYCGRISQALQKIREQQGDLETQRLLVQTKTVEDLLRLVK